MLFWLFVIIFIVSEILVVVSRNSDKHESLFLWKHDTIIGSVGYTVNVISVIVLVIMIIILISKYSTVNVYIKENRETYNALMYKIKSDSCRDDFGLLSKEVIDEIQDWNTDVVYYQNIQDNFWLGIFYPNVYDEFEKIDYEKYNID